MWFYVSNPQGTLLLAHSCYWLEPIPKHFEDEGFQLMKFSTLEHARAFCLGMMLQGKWMYPWTRVDGTLVGPCQLYGGR